MGNVEVVQRRGRGRGRGREEGNADRVSRGESGTEGEGRGYDGSNGPTNNKLKWPIYQSWRRSKQMELDNPH